jgi:hypothetical protein
VLKLDGNALLCDAGVTALTSASTASGGAQTSPRGAAAGSGIVALAECLHRVGPVRV